MKQLPIVSIAMLACLIGCGEAVPPQTDPSAKAQVIEEKPIYSSEEERNAKIDADPSIPDSVKDALKQGVGKLESPGAAPGTPNQGMTPTGP